MRWRLAQKADFRAVRALNSSWTSTRVRPSSRDRAWRRARARPPVAAQIVRLGRPGVTSSSEGPLYLQDWLRPENFQQWLASWRVYGAAAIAGPHLDGGDCAVREDGVVGRLGRRPSTDGRSRRQVRSGAHRAGRDAPTIYVGAGEGIMGSSGEGSPGKATADRRYGLGSWRGLTRAAQARALPARS